MNKAILTKMQLCLIVDTLRAEYIRLEKNGQVRSDSYMRLRSLEDQLGSLQGNVFVIEGKKLDEPDLSLAQRVDPEPPRGPKLG